MNLEELEEYINYINYSLLFNNCINVIILIYFIQKAVRNIIKFFKYLGKNFN